MALKSRLILLSVGFLLFRAAGVQAGEGSGGINAPEVRNRPTLILVSIDGFRWDYANLYPTPTLDRIAASGVRAEALVPVFPTLTFPNHYSIATGMYPARHGLIGNRFPSRDRQRHYSLYERETVQDGSWYGGEPVWVAAERHGLVCAAFYFVGTEAPVQGVSPTYWKAYDVKVPGSRRVEQVLDWLAMDEAHRPHLVTLYFDDVDTATHRAGPGSSHSVSAIGKVDGYLDQLLTGLSKLPIADEVYLLIVSDHGQARTRDEQPFIIDSVADLDGLTVVDHGAVAFIYFPEPDQERAKEIRRSINQVWRKGRAMLTGETPAGWHVTSQAGFADIIVQADPGYTVYSTAEKTRYSSIGDHGWAPEFPDMQGIFYATGPRLPRGLSIPPIEAVDIYPLLMRILELPVETAIDGDPDLLPALLTR